MSGLPTYAGRESGLRQVGHGDEDAIRSLLLGHTVTKVSDDHLTLDDGTLLRVVPNEGGCSCGAGDYDLVALNEVDNIITNVEFDYDPSGDYGDMASPGHYRVFVLAGNKRINLLDIEGDDGNGYYGTGFWFVVRDAEAAS